MTSDCNVFEFDVILQCNVFLVMRSLSSSTPFVECTLWSCYIRYVIMFFVWNFCLRLYLLLSVLQWWWWWFLMVHGGLWSVWSDDGTMALYDSSARRFTAIYGWVLSLEEGQGLLVSWTLTKLTRSTWYKYDVADSSGWWGVWLSTLWSGGYWFSDVSGGLFRLNQI